MTYLVADVGGTNTRLAVGTRDGVVPETVRSYLNTRFAQFDAVLATYRADIPTTPSAACVAVAGPVTSDRARLTNRAWGFDAAVLSDLLDAPVRLVNDLSALGYALPGMTPTQLHVIRPASGVSGTPQALVVGIGTGFNVCPVHLGGAAPVISSAELGHSSLPWPILQALETHMDAPADMFRSVEDLFSGRGLSRLYGLQDRGDLVPAHNVLARFDTDPRARQAVTILAEALGHLTREMICQYLPMQGVYFAGGVARGVLASGARGVFLDRVSETPVLLDQITDISLSVITDDAAALSGCLRLLTAWPDPQNEPGFWIPTGA